MKLQTLEQFESKDPCECGGNCNCGTGNKLNEAKKYKFKDLAKAWEFVYGEDMEDEYQGFYQDLFVSILVSFHVFFITLSCLHSS